MKKLSNILFVISVMTFGLGTYFKFSVVFSQKAIFWDPIILIGTYTVSIMGVMMAKAIRPKTKKPWQSG